MREGIIPLVMRVKGVVLTPRKKGSGRTLHACGGDSLLMFGDGGHHCGTDLSEISGSLFSRAAGSKIPGNFSILKFPGKFLSFSLCSLLCLQRARRAERVPFVTG